MTTTTTITITTTATDISKAVREYKELQEMEKALKLELDKVKAEIVEFLEVNNIDSYDTAEGRVSYTDQTRRTVDTVAMKAQYLDLYNQLLKSTTFKKFVVS